MRILLVDDEPVLRELFSDFLSSKGFEVETARDGREGVSKFRHGQFDAVVTDYQMPFMNGVLMIMEILVLEPNTRVVLMSADPPAARQIPVSVKVLRKPFRNTELLEALQ